MYLRFFRAVPSCGIVSIRRGRVRFEGYFTPSLLEWRDRMDFWLVHARDYRYHVPPYGVLAP